LHEVRLIANKKDIAFVEYMDEGSATVAKDALHNYKLDGENKIKVRVSFLSEKTDIADVSFQLDHVREEVSACARWGGCARIRGGFYCTMYFSLFTRTF
jgi:hypothetical protein